MRSDLGACWMVSDKLNVILNHCSVNYFNEEKETNSKIHCVGIISRYLKRVNFTSYAGFVSKTDRPRRNAILHWLFPAITDWDYHIPVETGPIYLIMKLYIACFWQIQKTYPYKKSRQSNRSSAFIFLLKHVKKENLLYVKMQWYINWLELAFRRKN